MFLFLLVIFPLISYFIFNHYKNDITQVNGATKLIGIIGILIFVILIDTKIINHGTYMIFIMFWYILVFVYYYYNHVKILNNNISKLNFNEFKFSNFILSIFYSIVVFIFYINLWDDYDIKKYLDILRHDSQGIVNIFFMFIISAILFGLIYKIIDSIKNYILTKVIEKKLFKQQIKQEILEELRNA